MRLSIPTPALPDGWSPAPIGCEAGTWLVRNLDGAHVWTTAEPPAAVRLDAAPFDAEYADMWAVDPSTGAPTPLVFDDGSAVLLAHLDGQRLLCPWPVVCSGGDALCRTRVPDAVAARWRAVLAEPAVLFPWRAYAGTVAATLQDTATPIGTDLATVAYAQAQAMGIGACEASWGLDGASVGPDGSLVAPHLVVEVLSSHATLGLVERPFLDWMDTLDAWIRAQVDPHLPHGADDVAQNHCLVGTGRLFADTGMGATPLYGAPGCTTPPNAHATLAAMGRLAERFGPLPEVFHAHSHPA